MSLRRVYDRLHQHHGPQHWWPARSAFEVMVGAVLTQNTAWTNVERAIVNLRKARALSAPRIMAVPVETLAEWLRPAGYFNVKARRLRNFCEWYLAAGGQRALRRWDTGRLRAGLLSVNGVGPETADDILLYAFQRPVFVIDAYTRRILARHGLVSGDEDYETLRRHIERDLAGEGLAEPALVTLYNEYHALIVRHAKDVCRPRPRCEICVLRTDCTAAQALEVLPRPVLMNKRR